MMICSDCEQEVTAEMISGEDGLTDCCWAMVLNVDEDDDDAPLHSFE